MSFSSSKISSCASSFRKLPRPFFFPFPVSSNFAKLSTQTKLAKVALAYYSSSSSPLYAMNARGITSSAKVVRRAVPQSQAADERGEGKANGGRLNYASMQMPAARKDPLLSGIPQRLFPSFPREDDDGWLPLKGPFSEVKGGRLCLPFSLSPVPSLPPLNGRWPAVRRGDGYAPFCTRGTFYKCKWERARHASCMPRVFSGRPAGGRSPPSPARAKDPILGFSLLW